MAARLTELVIDSADPAGLGAFWAAVLGREAVEDDEGDVELADPTGGPSLLFAAVPEGKHGKNRLHIDVSPTGCDQDEELARLLGLGARPADVGQGDETWIVLADPEGNEFCLLRTRVD